MQTLHETLVVIRLQKKTLIMPTALFSNILENTEHDFIMPKRKLKSERGGAFPPVHGYLPSSRLSWQPDMCVAPENESPYLIPNNLS